MSELAGIEQLLEKRAQYVKNIAEIDAQLAAIREKIGKVLGDEVQTKLGAIRPTRAPRATAASGTRAPRARKGGAMSVNEAILGTLSKDKGTSIEDIAKAVGQKRGQEANRKGLGVALSQLKAKKKITNAGLERGNWKLA